MQTDSKPCACTTASEPVEVAYESGVEKITEPLKMGCAPWLKLVIDQEKFQACTEKSRAIGRIDSEKQIVKLIEEFTSGEDQEVFYLIALDTQLNSRGLFEIARGARDRVQVPIPDLIRHASLVGAMGFIVVHNHPSGKANPSKADKQLTQNIAQAAEVAGMQLVDHVVMGHGEYYSLRAKNPKLFK